MGLALTRLNHDTAWLVELDGTRLLLDPWVEGEATIGLAAFHTARLEPPGAGVAGVPAADGLVLSHPYPDHGPLPVLARFPDRSVPVVAPPTAAWLLWAFGYPDVRPIRGEGLAGGRAELGRVRVTYGRGGALDPTHNVLVFTGLDSGITVLYAPHAMVLGGAAERIVAAEVGERLDALLVSFSTVALPAWLGGVANLGREAALATIRRFRPRVVVSTHDAEKPDRGFVSGYTRIDRVKDVRGLVGDLAEVAEVPFGARWTLADRAA